MLALACALLVPIATATPVAAQNPSLVPASGSPSSGPPGTQITYDYSYGDDCTTIDTLTYTPPYSIVPVWNGTTGASSPATDPLCSGAVSETVPIGTPCRPLCDHGQLGGFEQHIRRQQRRLRVVHGNQSTSDTNAYADPHPDPTSHPEANPPPDIDTHPTRHAETHAKTPAHTDAVHHRGRRGRIGRRFSGRRGRMLRRHRPRSDPESTGVGHRPARGRCGHHDHPDRSARQQRVLLGCRRQPDQVRDAPLRRRPQARPDAGGARGGPHDRAGHRRGREEPAGAAGGPQRRGQSDPGRQRLPRPDRHVSERRRAGALGQPASRIGDQRRVGIDDAGGDRRLSDVLRQGRRQALDVRDPSLPGSAQPTADHRRALRRTRRSSRGSTPGSPEPGSTSR